jgi:hypothetical protein
MASHRRKLARAEFHIQQLEELLTAWVANDGYRVWTQRDQEGRVGLLAQQLKPLPDSLGEVIGDALQCLRNSLDNLAYALAKRNTPAMSPKDEEEVSFPIYDKAVSAGAKAIRQMSPGARDDIRALAPDPGRQPLNEDPLWLLNKTANRDKHREITAVAVAYAIQSFGIFSGSIDELTVAGPQLLTTGGPPGVLLVVGPRTRINAQMRHGLRIQFDKGIEIQGREVIPTLRWFHDHIRDTVFQRLEPHL